jgi:hypothetical protein
MMLLALGLLLLAILGLWALASIERHHRRELDRAREERDRYRLALELARTSNSNVLPFTRFPPKRARASP